MNYMPRYESLKNSIDSIRDCFLQLKGRLYRQNLVFSEYNFPELNALKHAHFHNLQGSITSRPYYRRMLPGGEVEQQFFKIELKSVREDLEVRFEYFKRKFWDGLHNKESLTKIVLFTSSYFEYVKLKAFLEKVNASVRRMLFRLNAFVSTLRLKRCKAGLQNLTPISSESCSPLRELTTSRCAR